MSLPPRSPIAGVRRALRVLQMVHELHKHGYQRLRIMPGMSASGMHWRVNITPITNILRSNGAMAREFDEASAHYTTGMENRYFDWPDAHHDSARQLAVKFLERFAQIARAGHGRDWEYAGWYAEMLGVAESGAFPIAYADYYEAPRDGALGTTRDGVVLPAPPPGEADAPQE